MKMKPSQSWHVPNGPPRWDRTSRPASLLAATLFAGMMSFPGFAVDRDEPQPVRQAVTKVEQFRRQAGVVIMQKHTEIGTVQSLYGGEIVVGAREFWSATDASRRVSGVTVDVKRKDAERERTYLDMEDLGSLILAMQEFEKSLPALGRDPAISAHYQTRDGLKFLVFSVSSSGIALFVGIDVPAYESLHFSADGITQIRDLIERARKTLDP
ncbi:MAG: hypothetical protein ACT4QA_14685 [Panacagrimonas sp.]